LTFVLWVEEVDEFQRISELHETIASTFEFLG
jgi:hypothetical protein